MRVFLAWGGLAAIGLLAIGEAANSPLLEWRDPIYIIAGFAGIVALVLLLMQPLLAKAVLPGLNVPRARKAHRWIGMALVGAIVVHVAGLWITSPPDMIDALLFVSPTPFSYLGVIAMWGLFATAFLAAFRRRFRLRLWRIIHTSFALLIVTGSVAHAMLIEGTMGTVSKAVLCLLVVLVTAKVVFDLKVWAKRPAPR